MSLQRLCLILPLALSWLILAVALLCPGPRAMLSLAMHVAYRVVTYGKCDLLDILGSTSGGMESTRGLLNNAATLSQRVIVLSHRTHVNTRTLTFDVSSDHEHSYLRHLLDSIKLERIGEEIGRARSKPEWAIKGSFVPYVLDIGAYDGVTGSNSLNLLEMGWSGLLIEPLNKSANALYSSVLPRISGHSGRVKVAKIAVGLEDVEDGVIHQFDGSGMQSAALGASLYPSQTARYQESVAILSPKTILQRYGPVPSNLAVMSIDIESKDTLDIVSAFLKEGLKPAFIIIEWLGSTVHQRRWFAKENPNYKPLAIIGMNHIWRRGDVLDVVI